MADQPVLCVHIGHGKTGSSFLQSAFAHSVESLEAAGVDYPINWKLRRSAKGGISSGNAAGLIHFLDGVDKDTAKIPPARDGFRVTLVSGETVFPRLEQRKVVEDLRDGARAAGYAKVRLLMFIRDPISHCASSFQQAIKRGGATGEIDESAAKFAYVNRVEAVLDACEGQEDVELVVRNYSRVKRDLLGVTAEWLGVTRDALSLPAMAVVNRSLTRGELAFQRAVNQILGESGDVLADALCELLPDVKSDEVRPSLAAQRKLWARIEPVVTRINARIGEENAYRCDVDSDEPPQEERFSFTRRQIDVMAHALGAEIARLRTRATGDVKLLTAAIAVQGDMPENTKLLLELAHEFIEQDKVADAEMALRQLVAAAPNHAPAHLHLARLLSRDGRESEALPFAERSVQLAPASQPAGRLVTKLRKRTGVGAAVERKGP